jgi:hypothetical protein
MSLGIGLAGIVVCIIAVIVYISLVVSPKEKAARAELQWKLKLANTRDETLRKDYWNQISKADQNEFQRLAALLGQDYLECNPVSYTDVAISRNLELEKKILDAYVK